MVSHIHTFLINKYKLKSVNCRKCGIEIKVDDDYVSIRKRNSYYSAYKAYCINCARELNII